MKNKPKIIAVVGATASGKSNTALNLALDFKGEIVSCDSMQIYKGMDIGTAKPTFEEQKLVKHHLINIIEPSLPFSCADYKQEVASVLPCILERGSLPIFCGGTGLYLDTALLLENLSPDIPKEIRKSLEEKSSDELWAELMKIDPKSASSTHINNRKRVIRALEIYHGTGKTKTEWDSLSLCAEQPYDVLMIGLDYQNRDILYDRINRRVDIMMESGLLHEVAALKDSLSATAAQAIGYKELIMHLRGELSLSEAIELLKKNTRNYAKRQLTWFKRNKSTVWFYPDVTGDNTYNLIKNTVNDFLKNERSGNNA